MCKLYAIQTTMTKAFAAKVIAEKAKAILKTESDGLGISLHVDGVTRTWQCGQSLTDSTGGDVTIGLGDSLKMATLIMHGRTSTSNNKTVAHSHPRLTKEGPLMHNGIVFPKSKNGWKHSYDLDTDYLAELADRNELHLSAEYLTGYAGVLMIKNDGTLVVQNQGANLYMRLENENVEFGTTKALCDGTPFECMRAESLDCCVWIFPIESMGGRQVQYDRITNIGVPVTNHVEVKPKEPEEKKVVTGAVTHSAQAVVTDIKTGRTMSEIGPNPKKKGRYSRNMLKEDIEELTDSGYHSAYEKYQSNRMLDLDYEIGEYWHAREYSYSFGLSPSDIDDDLKFMTKKDAA